MRSPDEEPIIFDVADDAGPAKPAKVFETLHPLAIWENPTKLRPAGEPDVKSVHRVSRTRLAMVVGGALSLVAIGFSGGMYFENLWPSPPLAVQSPPDVADSYNATVDNETVEPQTTPDKSFESGLVPDEDTPSVFGVPSPARTTVRRRPALPRVSVARYRPRFSLATERRVPRLIHPQFWVSDFKPTTLVIYVENGEVRRRVEPWPSPGNK